MRTKKINQHQKMPIYSRIQHRDLSIFGNRARKTTYCSPSRRSERPQELGRHLSTQPSAWPHHTQRPQNILHLDASLFPPLDPKPAPSQVLPSSPHLTTIKARLSQQKSAAPSISTVSYHRMCRHSKSKYKGRTSNILHDTMTWPKTLL